MNKRIEYIDMLKGFAMVLVILGHMTYTPRELKILLYIFHIPLFFFLSGFTFSIKKYNNFLEFFIKKFKTIVIPYFLLNIAVFLFRAIILQPESILKIDILGFVKSLIIADRLHIYFQLWFLTSLFLSELVSYFIVKYSDNWLKWTLSFGILIILSFAGKLLYMNDFYLIWSFDTVPYATIFLLSGYIIKLNINKLEKLLRFRYFLPITVATIFIGIINYKLSEVRVDLYYQDTGYLPLFFVAAYLGIWSSFIFFKNINTIYYIEYIGKNTLVYYAFHSPIVLYILDIIFEQLINKYNGIFVNNYITTLCYLPLALIFCEIFSKTINNSFPILLGRK